MSIDVVRFEHESHTLWGVLREGKILRIPGDLATTGDLMRNTDARALAELEGPSLDANEVRIVSPLTRNQRFICQGANYRRHMIESGMDPDAKRFNMIFTKASSCIVAADSAVVRPNGVRFLDYELELGLVLRRDIRGPVHVTEENLHEFVGAAVIVNDYSARDVQIPQMQFYKGKSFRTFGPVGPHLTLLDENNVDLVKHLRLRLTVNKQVRQDDTTANLVYGPAETLTELSRIHDFEAGDLLSTGTPAGCALSVPSPAKQRIAQLLPERKRWQLFSKIQAKRTQYLRPGDLVEATIRSDDGRIDLGLQRNLIVAEG
jgi:2-keto-4-pentenoate hydratase/2-oxohepta-3-ene-1,7-dioic acid hydratase in catechol pathway